MEEITIQLTNIIQQLKQQLQNIPQIDTTDDTILYQSKNINNHIFYNLTKEGQKHFDFLIQNQLQLQQFTQSIEQLIKLIQNIFEQHINWLDTQTQDNTLSNQHTSQTIQSQFNTTQTTNLQQQILSGIQLLKQIQQTIKYPIYPLTIDYFNVYSDGFKLYTDNIISNCTDNNTTDNNTFTTNQPTICHTTPLQTLQKMFSDESFNAPFLNSDSHSGERQSDFTTNNVPFNNQHDIINRSDNNIQSPQVPHENSCYKNEVKTQPQYQHPNQPHQPNISTQLLQSQIDFINEFQPLETQFVKFYFKIFSLLDDETFDIQKTSFIAFEVKIYKILSDKNWNELIIGGLKRIKDIQVKMKLLSEIQSCNLLNQKELNEICSEYDSYDRIKLVFNSFDVNGQ